MKYLSIDIETTGLDPEKHQILEFAAVYDDLENPIPIEQLPTFSRRIYWDDLIINQYCLELHQQLLQEINDVVRDTKLGNDITTIDQLAGHFGAWLARNSSGNNYNVAGKNFAGFDGLFLKKVPDFPPWFYRVIDVGSMYFGVVDYRLPSLSDIVGKQTKHRAIDDALDVVKAIREKLLPKEI
jgi:oligoribonuclease